MNRCPVDHDFHTKAVNNGLDILGIDEILSQPVKMLDVKVQNVRPDAVFVLEFPYQTINKAQHVVLLVVPSFPGTGGG